MTTVTIVGNLTEAPELRYTNAGKAVAGFTVAVARRVKDGNEWKDGPTTFWRCSVWDAAAENLADSLEKGQRVIVVGDIADRSFETRDGEKRTVKEITATEVGPSLKWAVAKPEKMNRKGAVKPKTQDDPWTSAPADDEMPF